MKTLQLVDIKIGTHFRKDMGDIHTLARSIEEFGLLHPVVVDKDNQLIAGLRRIRAFKHLGRKEIPVTVIDLEDPLGAQYDENIVRKPFVTSEALAIKEAIEAKEVEKAKGRMVAAHASPGKLPEQEKGRVLDKAAKATGLSRRTLEKAAKVAAAAKTDSKKQKLVEEMDADGKVDKAYRKLKEAEQAEAAKAAQKYSTIVVCPDWESSADRRKIIQIPVWQWADEDCHLYMSVPNELIPKALDILKDWKFEYKTMLTWVKPRAGYGDYFRNSTEQIIFATRGKTDTRTKDVVTHFEAPDPGGNVKPDELYRIIERASSGPYIDALGKTERTGWVMPNGVAKK